MNETVNHNPGLVQDGAGDSVATAHVMDGQPDKNAVTTNAELKTPDNAENACKAYIT